MAFSLQFSARSDVGRVRKNNQDAGYASPTMLLVADGMGGAAAGDLASAVAAQVAARHDVALSGEEMLTHLSDVVAHANDRLAALVNADPTLDGMGTTFCGAMFDGEQLGLAHIGDSRCYLLRDGELEQVTHDHSWVQALIDEGRLTPEQAATHPHRSLIMRVLNGHPSMTPDCELVPVAAGDRVLFCSDGLSGMVSDETIAELMGLDDLDRAADELVEAANDAGGHDNITVVLAEVAEDDRLPVGPAVLVGSALEHDDLTGDLPAQDEDAEEDEPTAVVEVDEEAARYAPTAERSRWPWVVLVGLTVLALVGGTAWGVVAYARSRYFIGEASGEVGIYRGLPGSLLGYELNELTEKRPIAVSDLPRYYQRAVNDTITVPSLDQARATADELDQLATKCRQVREERARTKATPTPRPSASPTPAVPTAPTSSAPATVATVAPSPASPGTPAATPARTVLLPTTADEPFTPTYLTPDPTAASAEEADPEAC